MTQLYAVHRLSIALFKSMMRFKPQFYTTGIDIIIDELPTVGVTEFTLRRKEALSLAKWRTTSNYVSPDALVRFRR